MGEKSADCYIDVWREVDFGGESARVHGPAEYPSMRQGGADWGDDIGSLRVGPNAFVLAYRDENFKDELMCFGPNEEVADLRRVKFGDDIDSLRVIDSLKIFDRLTYNASGAREAAGAAEAGPRAGTGPGGPPKKRRKGKGR